MLRRTYPGSRTLGLAPNYTFDMKHAVTQEIMGTIDLRLSNTEHITHYAGHIGYHVKAPFRGHHYAARSCRLLFPLAKAHNLTPLWITCNPDNLASKRTLEIAGGVLVEIVPVPKDSALYRMGDTEKCRFRFDL